MRLGYFQFDCKFGAREENLERVWKKLKGETFELLVLPELFSTGYFFRDPEDAMARSEEIPHGPTTEFLVDLARCHQAFIVGGIAERGEERAFSSAVIAGPGGFVGRHRKLNLTGWEQKIFAPGSSINIFQLDRVRVGLALCYDLWFPELARIFLQQGVNLICHPANFGGPMSPIIARARAIENVMTVITANRTGKEQGPEGWESFRGESMIVDSLGEIRARAGNEEELKVVDLKVTPPPDKPLQLGADLLAEVARYNHPGRLEIREWQS